MKIYFAIKFYEDNSNRELIEFITATLDKKGHSCTVAVRDFEQWGQKQLIPKELMQRVRDGTREADIVLIELSEKGVGLGIEIGFAVALEKPITVLARKGTDISDTVKGSVDSIQYYKTREELAHILSTLS